MTTETFSLCTFLRARSDFYAKIQALALLVDVQKYEI